MGACVETVGFSRRCQRRARSRRFALESRGDWLPPTHEESRMEFGLFMMPLHPPHRTFADSYERDIAQIVLADQLGFREAWVGEHLTERWENAPAPDLLIAQALALTKTVRLGTGVTLLALHNPVYLAHRLRCSTTWPAAAFSGASAGAGSRPICRSSGSTRRPFAPARPKCSTWCSSCGRRTAASPIAESTSTSTHRCSIR